MVDKLLLRILKQGQTAWNEWKAENPRVRPKFRGVVLSNLDLSGVNLCRTNLSRAHLRETDLSEAILRGANLSRANLKGANLSGANLCEANLKEAKLAGTNLRRANLSRANLSKADLSAANLSRADLSGARLNDANITSADLRGANLTRANLSKGNLSNASLDRTILREADLRQAHLNGASLSQADLFAADLRKADLSQAQLYNTSFFRANLSNAAFFEANLTGADLSEADLTEADLNAANLTGADLFETNLRGANLEYSILIETDLRRAILKNCRVYGISAWDVKLDSAIQSNLIITPVDAPTIQVDNLDVAQFIYLLLNNKNVRHVIDTISSKLVLILGNFAPERKDILDALRDELRNRDYLPILFDFKGPETRDLTETVSTLAHMARFVIADITDPRSVPHELMAIVPRLTSVPVQPLLLSGHRSYAMFEHFKRFPGVLKPFLYTDRETLISSLERKVIAPAEEKAKELTGRK